MAHFAQLDDNNVVIQVIVVSNDDCSDGSGTESESIGVAFCLKLLGANTNWKQTSYNASLDAFVPPQPFPSWTLNNTTAAYDPPLTEPTLTEEQITAGSYYVWDEDAYQADNTTGWVLTTPE